MARQQGTYKLASNIEPRAAAPLDAREKVALKNDLTATGTFPYPYEGMEVYVVEEKKKYILIGNDPTVANNWQEVGSGGSGQSLNELEDVNIVNPANSQILKYDAINGKWINSELTGEYPEIVLSDNTGQLYIEIRNAFCIDKTKTGNKDNCNVFSITVQNRDESAIYDRTYLLYCHSFYTGSLSVGTAKALMLLDGSMYFPEDYDSTMTGIYINRSSNIVYIKQRSGGSNNYITVRQIAGIKSDNLSVSTVSSASGATQVEDAFLNPVRTDGNSGIELANGRIGIREAFRNPTFLGTQEEWDELSASEKTKYKYANITDDEASSAEAYSTEETYTGKVWIDGKPIYRKVFAVNNINTTQTAAWVTILQDSWVETIDTIISSVIIGEFGNVSSGKQRIIPFDTGISNNILKVYTGYTVSIKNNTCVLEYTKTTD